MSRPPAERETPRPLPEISIIIPTLDEADCIGRTLESGRDAERVEVIVCDGGSSDATAELVRRDPSARLIIAPAGRAAQMNCGAALARGEILLFLHADCVLPRGGLDALRCALQRDGAALGGAFGFRLDSPRRRYRLLEWGVRLRNRYLALPYGDQGIFVRRSVFARMGGFRPLRICEDLDFVRRLRRRGPIVELGVPLVSSVRRWERHGLVRTTLRNWFYLALFASGLLGRFESASPSERKIAKAAR